MRYIPLSLLFVIPNTRVRRFTFLLILATQLTGFALAGMCRRFLVWPASLIWPANLVTCTLLNTLHAEDDASEGSGVSRFRFFLYATFAAFVWYFLPGAWWVGDEGYEVDVLDVGFLFTGLSIFSFVCWIRPSTSHESFSNVDVLISGAQIIS